MRLIYGDAMEAMRGLEDKSIDMVLTDPPYGVTKGEEIWRAHQRPVISNNGVRGQSRDPNNATVDWGGFWEQIRRVTRPGAAVLIMGVQPFLTDVITSNRSAFRYDWIWEKGRVTGALNARIRPMTGHISIAVFGIGKIKYRPQGRPDDPSVNPKSVIRFPSIQRASHFSEKPVPLLEYLIRTYTDKDDVVLDPFMGSGSTGEAAIGCGRGFVGIDIQEWCVDLAVARLARFNT